MDITTGIAIYGAIVSSALATITIYNFWRQSHVLKVEHQTYFDGEGCKYTFLVSNVSDRTTTIYDCGVSSISVADGGKEIQQWSTPLKLRKSVFAHQSDGEILKIPYRLPPGEMLVMEVDSEFLIDRFDKLGSALFNLYPDWQPTDRMNLGIEHSIADKPVAVKFELEENERELGFSRAKSRETQHPTDCP